jgi:hypothetical protein
LIHQFNQQTNKHTHHDTEKKKKKMKMADFNMILILLTLICVSAPETAENTVKIEENKGAGNCGPIAIGQCVGVEPKAVRQVVSNAVALRAVTGADDQSIPTIKDKESNSYVLANSNLPAGALMGAIKRGLKDLPEASLCRLLTIDTNLVKHRVCSTHKFDPLNCDVCRLAAYATAVGPDTGDVYWFGDLDLSIYSEATCTLIQIVNKDNTLGKCYAPARILYRAIVKFSGEVEQGHYESISLKAVTNEIINSIKVAAHNFVVGTTQLSVAAGELMNSILQTSKTIGENDQVQEWLQDAGVAYSTVGKAMEQLLVDIDAEVDTSPRLDRVFGRCKDMRIAVGILNR